ncbi:MAG: hypothetical protein P8178_08815, partial [Candidatus Thiodiazotropha sp.]
MTRGTPLQTALASMILPQQESWLGLAPLRQVIDPAQLAQRIDGAVDGVGFLDVRQETSRLIGEFRQQILQRISLGVLIMLAVLWVGLRSLIAALNTLLPIALALLLTVSLLDLWGESMNLFHLISLLLVLGIGIDYSLFFSCQADD